MDSARSRPSLPWPARSSCVNNFLRVVLGPTRSLIVAVRTSACACNGGRKGAGRHNREAAAQRWVGAATEKGQCQYYSFFRCTRLRGSVYERGECVYRGGAVPVLIGFLPYTDM